MPRGVHQKKHKELYEMRREQTRVNPVIPSAPFTRIVHEIANKYAHGIRFKQEAIDALQVDSESFVIDLLHKANMLTVSSGRETLTVRDIRLIQRLNTEHIT